jgi:hypothetical protein
MNRIVWLGDSYLELVGVFDPGLAEKSWFGRPVLASLEAGGGLVGWAVAVDSLEETLRWVPADSGLVGPIDGERGRPDARIVRWHIAHPGTLSPADPFLIEHDTASAEWTPEERAGRDVDAHPLGGRARLAGLTIETAAPAVAAGRIRRLLAASVEPAGRAAVRVRVGPHEVRFAATTQRSPAVIDVVADVPLRTKVARIGSCEIRLRGLPAVPVADPDEDLRDHV